MSDSAPEIRMIVKGLMLDPTNNGPIVILKQEDSELFLPIWIGVFEASAIQLRLEGVAPARPMTHDLLASVLGTIGATVEKVVIHDLIENTFFALVHVRAGDDRWEIDSRPSDALALALRVDAPIFVHQRVLDKAHSGESSVTTTSEEEKLKKWFEELDPDDLGKYEM